mgnify:CR=1 FL=1
MPEELPRVAGVRFRNAGRIFYFHTAGMRLEPGEFVVVETTRGPEVAKVVIAPGQVVVNELGREDLKPILRLATEADIRKADELRRKAEELLPEARRLGEELGFPAHIDGAEFTLDGRRLTFSFTSEERIDYREFVKRAGDRFKARVEMRQMGPRDRARQAGGYGICGRELCCSSWLATFPSISIRMAKEQDLPLNPQKISGLCGRLLCCLSYEEEGYNAMRKSLPKIGQRCSTPTGEGKVIAINILRRQVTLVVDGQRIEVGDAVEEGLPAPLVEAEITEAERIEHRGHAGRGALRVMREHRGTGRPAGIAARLHLAFEVVGMHVHHAGDQVVALQVARAGRVAAAGLHIGDAPVADQQRAVDDLTGQDEEGVGQDGLGVHAASWWGSTS